MKSRSPRFRALGGIPGVVYFKRIRTRAFSREKRTKPRATPRPFADVPRRIVREHVFAAEAVYLGPQRIELVVFAEYVVPRVEKHVLLDVDHGEIPVGPVDDRPQVAELRGQERFELGVVQPGPPRLIVTVVVVDVVPHAEHVARMRFVQRHYSQLQTSRPRVSREIYRSGCGRSRARGKSGTTAVRSATAEPRLSEPIGTAPSPDAQKFGCWK